MSTTSSSESYFWWVWEANRGKPVGEKATLSFEANGNLVLADADGRVAWQTHTVNEGAVGLKLLPNGNLVLHDSKGKFVRQKLQLSHGHFVGGPDFDVWAPDKVVSSRKSKKENSNGPCSLVLKPKLGLSRYNFDYGQDN